MSEKLQIKISDSIYIVDEILPSELLAVILSDLTIDNPKYFEAKKYGRSTRKIPSVIKLYEKNKRKTDTKIKIPRGYIDKLKLHLEEHDLPYVIKDDRAIQQVDFNNLEGRLRSYQEPVVNKTYESEQGVIESPCGSGKTVMGIFLLAMCGQKTLWITHTKDLLYQTVSAMENILQIPKEQIGIIGDGKKSFGKKVTVGLVQSLISYDPETIRDQFGTVIVDEAHRVPSRTFKEIVENTASKYRFGLTATPKRKDGLESVLFNVMGPVISRITERDLVQEEQILIPDVFAVWTSFKSNRVDNFNRLLAGIIKNKKRNQLIADVIKATMKKDDTALVLSTRVEHCEVLKKLLDDVSDMKVSILTGKVNKEMREEILAQARNGRINIIIATKLADEGLDIPNLTKLYLVTPSKAQSKIKQQLGRVMRKSDGKSEASVYDFVDSNIGLLRRQFNLRKSVYIELGCNIRDQINN